MQGAECFASPQSEEMFTMSRRLLFQIAVVPIAVIAAMLARLLLWPILGKDVPFLLLWPAVMFSAWFGGLVPGMLTTLLAALSEMYFVLEPPRSFHVSNPAEAVGVVLFILLGTAVSLMAEWLHRYNRAIQEEYHRKDLFLTTIAHELRNPLAPIRNALAILKTPGVGPETVTYATEVLDRQVGQMTHLVDDLLDVSRIARGKVQLQKEPVELAAVVHQAVEASRPLIEARHQDLAVTLPPSLPPLPADPARLAQVLTNLLNNAAKYTDEGGHIRLAVEQNHDEVTVRVRDTGMGIPPEMLPRIFDVFTQVDGARNRSQGGMGLGLALVRGLVELHGGRVEAHSEGLGKGSEFVVHLPRTPAQPETGRMPQHV
jgi:signal transduction histidine kinase